MGIRILLAEDQGVMREGLHALLFRQPDFEVVGCVDNGKKAIEKTRTTFPDVVIMDAHMPEMDGVTATKKILEDFPQIKIIFLSIYRNQACVNAAMDAGASGYVLKDGSIEELVDAVRRVYGGENNVIPNISFEMQHPRKFPEK